MNVLEVLKHPQILASTVKSPNKGHIGDGAFSLAESCPLLGGFSLNVLKSH